MPGGGLGRGGVVRIGCVVLLFCVFSFFFSPFLFLFSPPSALFSHPQPAALNLGHLLGGGFGRAGAAGVSWHSNCCSGTKGGFFAATVAAASQNSKSARLGTTPASLRVAEGWYVGG